MKLLFSGIREILCLLFNKKFRLSTFEPSVFCLAFVFSFLGALGQPKGEGEPSPAGSLSIAPLSVGDTMPTVQMQTFWPAAGTISLPQPGPAALTLIYFWHTACTGCWFKFPLLDSLEKQFAGRVKIVTVTAQKEEVVKAFQQRQAQTKGVGLTGIHADTLLKQMFPFLFVSHVAWVEGSGRVVAITGPGLITEANIVRALSHEKLNLPVKRDISYFKPDRLLFGFNTKAGYNLEPSNLSYAAWAGHLPGVESGIFIGNARPAQRFTAVNISLRQLIAQAHLLPPFATQWLMPDSLKALFFKPDSLAYEEWLPNHSWCLEMVYPPNTDKKNIKARIHRAIEDRFGISIQPDSAGIPCFKVSGKGKPGGNLLAITELYVYNEWSVAFLSDETTAETRLQTAPDPMKQVTLQALQQWAAVNDLSVSKATCRVPVIRILPYASIIQSSN